MSIPFKMIIPLLDDNIDIQDISASAGFVDAFDADINRPYLDNHIFLMYTVTLDTPEAIERNEKFKHLSSLYKEYIVTISGNVFVIYAFVISKSSIKHIVNGNFALSDKDKMSIFAFWNLKDTDINAYMLDPLSSLYFKFVGSVIPEEDYRPEHDLFMQ